MILTGVIENIFPEESKKPLQYVYKGMIRRCYKQNDRAYKNYGAKGVVVCDEWLKDRNSFFTWAINNGWKKGLQIDKDIKGNGKLYGPNTCCFVTSKENIRAKNNCIRVIYNGKEMTLVEVCDILGLNSSVVRQRMISYGRTFEEAISKPTGMGQQLIRPKRGAFHTNKTKETIRKKVFERPPKRGKYKGINKHGNRWNARATVNGIRIYLGWFDTDIEAALAYNEAAIKYYGPTAYLNKIS